MHLAQTNKVEAKGPCGNRAAWLPRTQFMQRDHRDPDTKQPNHHNNNTFDSPIFLDIDIDTEYSVLILILI